VCDWKSQFLAGRNRGGLVEKAHPIRDSATPHQRDAFQREAHSLEVGHAERPPKGRGPAGQGGRPVEVPAHVHHVRALVEREPAVVLAVRQIVEHPVSAFEPAARHRILAAELEKVGRQPGRDASRAGLVAGGAEGAVGALSSPHGQIRIVEPPTGPAEALPGIPGLSCGECRLELPARVFPIAPAQGFIAGGERLGGQVWLGWHVAQPMVA
jgi:hypothetical protein